MGVNAWCLFRSSGKVKAAIRHEMEKRGLKYNDLAKMADVRAHRMNQYLNHVHEGGRPSITQFQLMKVCKALGIDVTILIDNNYNV